MSYALQIVQEFAKAVAPVLHDDERPKLIERGGSVVPAHAHLAAKPGSVYVFINPAHRMILLRGDEYRPDLCRKINESRYGPPYSHAPVIGSENSEDATTWTFLRTLEKRCRPEWITRLLELATGIAFHTLVDRVVVRFWFGRLTDETLPVPPGVNETPTELDALIEFYLNGALNLVAVEAKVTSPFSGWDRDDRDQFARIIDVGSYYAATRYVNLDRYWTIAILPQVWGGTSDRNPHAVVSKYKGNVNGLRNCLRHRLSLGNECGALTEQDLNLLAAHIGTITWEQLIEIGGQTMEPNRRRRS